MNQWDYEPLETLFGYQAMVTRLESGDLLFLRPPYPEKDYILAHVRDQVCAVLPRGVKAVIIPARWEVGVARPARDDSIIKNLQAIAEDLR